MTSIFIITGDKILSASLDDGAISQNLISLMPFDIKFSRWDDNEYFSTPPAKLGNASNIEGYLLDLKATLFIKSDEIQFLLPVGQDDKEFVVTKVGEVESAVNEYSFGSEYMLVKFGLISPEGIDLL